MFEGGREIKEGGGVFDRKQGLAESCTPSFASKAMVQFSAGSRRANENHGLSLIARWTGRDRRTRADKGGRGASASRHAARPRIAHGARDGRMRCFERFVECCVAGFVQGQSQILAGDVEREA